MMRNVPMIAMAFLVASFCAFKTPTAFAQTNTCALALDVATTDKNFRTKPVNGVRATALNTSSGKSIPAVLLVGQPVFSALTDGEYRITVTKTGFERVVQPISFKCELMHARATMQIDLDPGNFRRSVIARSQSITARGGVATILGGGNNLGLPELFGRKSPTPPAIPKGAISGGVLNGKAISLPKPAYPPIARQARASGTVIIQVIIDEEGNVISAWAVSGHPLLQAVSQQAARAAKFSPTKLSGQAVKVTGIITYSFVLPQEDPGWPVAH